MTTPAELTDKFWRAVHADRTMMVGLAGVDDGHMRPMTAVTEGERGPIWLFTSQQASLVTQLDIDTRAIASFVDKGHNLFASIHGRLVISNDPEVIDRLWNPMIAAWYAGGRQDPDLTLLRFEAEDAEIWLSETGPLAGLKMLFGKDPKADYADKVATVKLDWLASPASGEPARRPWRAGEGGVLR
jgi:general stress protein 26